MACKIGQIAIGHIGQIKGCFTKVPPCVRARLKLCGNGVTSVQSVLYCFGTHRTRFPQTISRTHRTHYPQTASANGKRAKLPCFLSCRCSYCVCDHDRLTTGTLCHLPGIVGAWPTWIGHGRHRAGLDIDARQGMAYRGRSGLS